MTASRRWALLLWLSAVGCTCDSRRCVPETCAGCCSTDDRCVLGGPSAACGLLGAACADCGKGACVGGSCTRLSCDAMSCPPDKVCDADAGLCIARPACLPDAGCPEGLRCTRELRLCATYCTTSDDCPVSSKNCSFTTCRCTSDAICRSGLADAGSLVCDPVGKLCR